MMMIFWDELARVFAWWNLSWCLGGDFNVIRFPWERSRLGGIWSAMKEFLDFISELGLLDIPLTGGQFAWSNNRASQTWSRIDQFLFGSCWESL